MASLQILNLEKTFKGKKRAIVKALKGISLSIESGEVFGFLGPNGAGKSTTIKILMGLISPTSGTATIAGIPIERHEARSCVGYLPENPAFYDYLTAYEYLQLVASAFAMDAKTFSLNAENTLKKLELWDARNRPIRGYSKGMVQRVGLAQVLVHDPQIYILDEPMSGLDPLGRALVKDIIRDLKKAGKTVFFSTHIISDVESICDRTGIIIEGELKVEGAVEQIIAGGVEGYSVTYNDSGALTTEFVGNDNLLARLNQLETSGLKILLVEPHRKSLEEFFLQVVHNNV